MKSIDWEQLKKTKITIPIAVLVVGAFLAWEAYHNLVGWHFDTFVSKAEASDLTKAVQSNAAAINTHINEYKINETEKAITGVEDALFNLAQWEDVNGSTAQTRERRHALNQRLADWKEYKNCLVMGVSNCDSVRP